MYWFCCDNYKNIILTGVVIGTNILSQLLLA